MDTQPRVRSRATSEAESWRGDEGKEGKEGWGRRRKGVCGRGRMEERGEEEGETKEEGDEGGRKQVSYMVSSGNTREYVGGRG
jgi:hypothetical protein